MDIFYIILGGIAMFFILKPEKFREFLKVFSPPDKKD